MEKRQIDPARPWPQPHKAAHGQLFPHAFSRHHHALTGGVEPPQKAGGHRPGDAAAAHEAETRGAIFRKARVVGGGEMQLVAACKGARRKTERPFGGDMQGVGPERFDEPGQPSLRQQSQSDFRIGRARHGPETVGSDHVDHVAHRAQFSGDGGEGANHPVHLRRPCVGDDQNARRKTPDRHRRLMRSLPRPAFPRSPKVGWRLCGRAPASAAWPGRVGR